MKKLIICCFLLLSSISTIFADQKYKVSDLCTLSCGDNEAVFINEFSEVCIRMGKYEPKKIESGNFLRNKPRTQVDAACYVWNPKTGLKYVGTGQGFRPVFL
jgi:hypothetical protein